MALTRKFLKAMGIEDDKVDQIIEAHSETVEALKEERDKFKEEAKNLPNVQKELDELKARTPKDGVETVSKEEYDKIKDEYSAFKNEVTQKEAKAAKEKAVRQLFKEIGISEKRMESVLKVTDIDSIKLDKDGKIEDSDKLKESAKTEWADFIETVSTQGANSAKPPYNSGNGSAKTRDEILSIKDGTERRSQMAKNPQLFPELGTKS